MAHAIEKLDADWFANTRIYQRLRNSERVMRATAGNVKDLWLEPNEFIKTLSEILYEQTTVVDQDVWVLNYGYEGSGKSSLGLMLYDGIAKIVGWDSHLGIREDLIFMQSEYAKTMYAFSELDIHQHAIDIDDAHYVFGKYYGMTNETKSILQLARFFRDQQIIHLLNTQVPQQLFRDIWLERIGPYIYCWGINTVNRENINKIAGRWMFAAYYSIEKSMILRESKWVRKPLAWRKTITTVVPDYITRFDVLFPRYSELYFNHYKLVKQFYKRFYAYLRYLGVVKGTHFEIIFKLLYRILKEDIIPLDAAATEQLQRMGLVDRYPEIDVDSGNILDSIALAKIVEETVPKRMHQYLQDIGILRETDRGIFLDKNLYRIALQFGDVILQRGELLERRATLTNG